MRYGSWVADCLHILDGSSSLDDLRLSAWVRLQRIAEESLAVVGLEDGAVIDMSDGRTKLIIDRCIEQIIQWKHATPSKLITSR